MNLQKFASVLLVCTLLPIGCQSSTKRYDLHGQVLAVNLAHDEIAVRHDEISGLMPAMAMQYKVADSVEIRDLKVGDDISATLVVSKSRDQSWLEKIRVTGHSASAAADSRPANRMLFLGEVVPDIPLVNQDGRTIHFADFSGQALLITFIYTRCPMPDYCPRLSGQFARIHHELKKHPSDYPRTHLLTISFDPEYDTPAVLRKYGLAYLDGQETGFSHWDFATVTANDLERLAAAFGLQYEHQDNQIVHTMNIILVAPNSTVRKYWSTEWTWQELTGQKLGRQERSAEKLFLCASRSTLKVRRGASRRSILQWPNPGRCRQRCYARDRRGRSGRRCGADRLRICPRRYHVLPR